jgi:hypothetical protein
MLTRPKRLSANTKKRKSTASEKGSFSGQILLEAQVPESKEAQSSLTFAAQSVTTHHLMLIHVLCWWPGTSRNAQYCV